MEGIRQLVIHNHLGQYIPEDDGANYPAPLLARGEVLICHFTPARFTVANVVIDRAMHTR